MVRGQLNMFSFVTLAGLLISFCGAFVAYVPVIWYRNFELVPTSTSGFDEYGRVVFAQTPTLNIDEMNAKLKREKGYAIGGLVLLGVGVFYDVLGLLFNW